MYYVFILVVCMSFYNNMLVNSSKEFSPTIAQGNGIKKKSFVSGELIFEDKFDKLDLNKWSDDGNNLAHINEFQLYTGSTENSYVKNGILHIRPTLVNQTKTKEKLQLKEKYYKDKFHPIRSARISTKESFSFTYGVVEVRARIPSGDWLFPAIWLMPRDSNYGVWPLSGEIDIMESRGNKNLTDSSGTFVGVQQFGSTLHWGTNGTLDQWKLTHFTSNLHVDFSLDYHTYKLVWTPQILNFYVDNKEVGIIAPPEGGFWKMGKFGSGNNPWVNGTRLAPFDKQFYLILNTAVGGTLFFSDSYTNQGGKPWNNSSPNASSQFWEGRDQWLPTWNLPSDDSHFLIDYVRVWAL